MSLVCFSVQFTRRFFGGSWARKTTNAPIGAFVVLNCYRNRNYVQRSVFCNVPTSSVGIEPRKFFLSAKSRCCLAGSRARGAPFRENWNTFILNSSTYSELFPHRTPSNHYRKIVIAYTNAGLIHFLYYNSFFA
jgi:hypothetical protein